MVIFKGSMTASSVLLNQTVRVPTMFSLVNFSPDQSLPHQTGLKSTSFTLHILRTGLKAGHSHIYCCHCHFPHCLALPGKGNQKGSKRFLFLSHCWGIPHERGLRCPTSLYPLMQLGAANVKDYVTTMQLLGVNDNLGT